MGTNSIAAGGQAVSIGANNTAFGNGAVAIGDPSYASGTGAFTGGANNIANSDGTASATAANQANGAVAIGNNNKAIGQGSVALGNGSTAGGAGLAGNIALGDGATAAAKSGDVALGSGSVTVAAVGTPNAVINGITFGNFAGTTPGSTVSVGAVGAERTITNVAAGRVTQTSTDAINGSQLYSVANTLSSQITAGAIHDYSVNSVTPGTDTNYNNAGATGANALAAGVSASAAGASSVAVGAGAAAAASSDTALGSGARAASLSNSPLTGAIAVGAGQATNDGAIAIGDGFGGGPKASGRDSVALGTGTTASGSASTALGAGATASGTSAFAGGTSATASQANSLALGAGANAANAGAVALGFNSVTVAAVGTPNAVINGITFGNFAGTTPGSTVSIGAVGAERTITNVAAGRVTQTSTDAINGSQLYSVANTLSSQITAGAIHDYSVNSTTPGTDTNYNNAGATGANALAAGVSASAAGTSSVAVGTGATAVASSDTALGSGARAASLSNSALTGAIAVGAGQATNDGAIAIGNGFGGGPKASGRDSIALGTAATAANDGAVALGSGSQTTAAVGTSGITIGTTAYSFAGTTPLSTVSVGAVGAERTITNVAAGRISNGSTDAINGSQLFAATSAIDSLSTVVNSGLTHYYGVNDGGTQQANYNNNGATGTNSMAAGVAASAAAANSSAIGFNSSVTVADGVAIGSGSVSNRAIAPASGKIGGTVIPYNTTDLTLLGALSVGNATSYRQITNVADGTQDSDAVTVRQLTGALTSFATTTTKYFHANSTLADSLAVGNNSVAVGPQTVVNGDNGIGMGNGATVAQTAPGGIAIGQNSTSNFADSIAFGTNATANGIQSVSIGAGSQTTNPTSVALGPNAKATAQAGDVALGANSTTSTVVATKSTTIAGTTYNFAGTTPTSTVSVGSAGAERTITNVAAGQISAISTDAINGSQLWATNTSLAALYTTVSNISTGGGGVKYFHANSTAADSIASGAESVAIGPQSVASGANAISMGNGSAASADNSVAIGAGAKATAANSLALGANSTTTANLSDAAYTPVVGKAVAGVATGEVSVGSAGAERRVTNVAAGSAATDAVNVSQLQAVASSSIRYDSDGAGGTTNRVTLNSGNTGPVTISNVAAGVAGTDAVNVNQLNSAFQQLNGQIGEVRQDAWRAAAIGMAAASLRYDDRPGKISASAGGGVWRSQGALAFGIGYTSENSRLRSNLAATTAGSDWGVSAGVSLTLN
nr:YadA-like family protein [Bradyrhizobium sp. Ce-3]